MASGRVMHPLPHHYRVTATCPAEGNIPVSSEGLPTLQTAPPAEFGGPGDRWSPETLLVAAVIDCFLLTFRSVSRASKLSWSAMTCECVGTVGRAEKQTQFTEIRVKARLTVPSDVSADRARRVMEKAKAACLITNSLSAETILETEVDFTD